MPAKSQQQFKFMQGVAHGTITAPEGLSKAEAKEFVDATPDYKSLPKKKGEGLAAHRKKLGLRPRR